jgi:Uma2 family endonuclease
MSHVAGKALQQPDEAEPAWEVARLFPPQGEWEADDYLALNSNRLVELADGVLEVLPMPTTSHQLLVAYLYGLLLAFVGGRGLGTVLFAPLRVRLGRRKFREPDVVCMLAEHAGRMRDEYWEGADLVMEVVSGTDEDRRRDLQVKRREYARAGIPEYWVVDPAEQTITVLRLAGKRYAVHGAFPAGTVASSHLLPDFTVDVTAAFARRVPSGAPAKGARKGKRRPG